jgi:hypothetical protein
MTGEQVGIKGGRWVLQQQAIRVVFLQNDELAMILAIASVAEQHKLLHVFSFPCNHFQTLGKLSLLFSYTFSVLLWTVSFLKLY